MKKRKILKVLILVILLSNFSKGKVFSENLKENSLSKQKDKNLLNEFEMAKIHLKKLIVFLEKENFKDIEDLKNLQKNLEKVNEDDENTLRKIIDEIYEKTKDITKKYNENKKDKKENKRYEDRYVVWKDEDNHKSNTVFIGWDQLKEEEVRTRMEISRGLDFQNNQIRWRIVYKNRSNKGQTHTFRLWLPGTSQEIFINNVKKTNLKSYTNNITKVSDIAEKSQTENNTVDFGDLYFKNILRFCDTGDPNPYYQGGSYVIGENVKGIAISKKITKAYEFEQKLDTDLVIDVITKHDKNADLFKEAAALTIKEGSELLHRKTAKRTIMLGTFGQAQFHELKRPIAVFVKDTKSLTQKEKELVVKRFKENTIKHLEQDVSLDLVAKEIRKKELNEAKIVVDKTGQIFITFPDNTYYEIKDQEDKYIFKDPAPQINVNPEKQEVLEDTDIKDVDISVYDFGDNFTKFNFLTKLPDSLKLITLSDTEKINIYNQKMVYKNYKLQGKIKIADWKKNETKRDFQFTVEAVDENNQKATKTFTITVKRNIELVPVGVKEGENLLFLVGFISFFSLSLYYLKKYLFRRIR